jgi:hypothetical protein
MRVLCEYVIVLDGFHVLVISTVYLKTECYSYIFDVPYFHPCAISIHLLVKSFPFFVLVTT